ncbi:MAG: phosphoglycerate dehydrogenase [Pseudobdellovibrionaceae bacterium]
MKPLSILLAEAIHPVAKSILEAEGFHVDLISHAPSAEELRKLLPNYDVLGIRSKTNLEAELFQEFPRLLAVGAFCIGTNQVAVNGARSQGIPVFNAPHSNTRSVAELVICEMIALSRQLGDRNTAAHSGNWMKTAEGSKEVRGKTLGIVGYGHIGSQLSILAEALGLKVVFYDVVKKLPLGNARPCTNLEELVKVSDFVSLHVPETTQTKDMIGREQIATMKKGSFLINASRGTVVVIEELAKALKSGHISGAAVDVFPWEPASNKEKFKTDLQGLPNVILTPHIGGSTEEAQYAIGIEVAESLIRYLTIGSSSGAVNFPHVDLPGHQGTTRILNVHRNEPGVLGEINSVASRAGANIQYQYLATDANIGYLIMDLEKAEADSVAEEIRRLSRSIKTRIVYSSP